MKKVSELLREERERQGLTLEDIARATKIKKTFLEHIEEGEYDTLPSHSYTLGFVKAYAAFLGLSTHKTSAFLRREVTPQEVEIMPRFRKDQHTIGRRLLFSPRSIFIFLAVLVVGVYVFFQYGSLFVGPKLSVTRPKNRQVIRDSVVEVAGKTDPYATVSVDGEEAYVDIAGSFRKSVYVFSGERKITVVSKNRFGKETRQTLTVKVP